MASGTLICNPAFMKTGSGIQVTVRYYSNNVRGCSAEITEEEDFRIMQLTWP
jgi:hypothetical protein